jgi:small GTP-binding protein
MKNRTFDVKVALLGNVSAGKSTVLNALLQGKYSEVAMRRATAGVNFFRVHATGDTTGTAETHLEVAPDIESLEPESIQTSNETLQTITTDNAILRDLNEIQEKTFDIEHDSLDQPICHMRKDTKLVLIDIPGLNDAESKDLYQNYVSSKWKSFDCVIVVVDYTQAVNTEEQVQLLSFVNDNLKENRNIPVIVLCNKVDDPSDEETQMLVSEVSCKVHEVIFVPGKPGGEAIEWLSCRWCLFLSLK